jgi:ribonucleoside-diphosphate reductase alpha chain
MKMEVIKRNGCKEEVSFDKIKNRINKMANLKPLLTHIDSIEISQKVIARIYDNIRTDELDEETASICTSLITRHPEYNMLGSRIIISNNQKKTNSNLEEKLKLLVDNNIITVEIYNIYLDNKETIDNAIDYERDFNFDYFGFKTLEKSYLQKVNGETIERIQDLLMRVSIGIHKTDITSVIETYNLMSNKYFIHASPTLYNAGTLRPQLLSCFLLGIDDSITGIYKCLNDCANISKWAGGIGLHISNIRGKNSYINGTNGYTSGIVPMLRVFNSTARYVNQCFLPDTPIYTINGLKYMEDIACGDKLVTNDGSFQEVLKVYNDNVEDRDIISIQSGVTNCKVTMEHPFYVLQNQKELNYSIIKNRLNNKLIEPEYVESQKLTKDDFMIYPIPTYTHDINEYTLEDCYMYGLMLNNGHITKNTNEYSIILNQTKKDLCNWVKDYLDQNLLQYSTSEYKDSYSIHWDNCHRNKFQRNMLYNNESNKIIHTSMLHLPTNKVWNILCGLINSNSGNEKELYYYSSSLTLIQSMIYLLMKVEILPELCECNSNSESNITTKIVYQLCIPKTKELCDKLNIEFSSSDKFFKYENYLYSKIKKITYEKYSGNVIEFDINKNHNYLTPIGIAHNGGKRLGSFAIYLEPHHSDILDFLELKKNHGLEEERARDLFYGLWISDLFMERVKNNQDWSLFSPDLCKNLENSYGDAYKELYIKYENEGKAVKTISAQQIWFKICTSQIETGTPYILYKDSANRKSNQRHYGTIKSSNLCVAPDTLVLTDNGHFKIKDLHKKNVNVWNGKEFSNVKVCQTGTNQDLVKVSFSDSSTLECTPEHKFYIQEKYNIQYNGDIINHKNVKSIEAKNLKKGMKLIKCDYPVINNKKELKSPYYTWKFDKACSMIYDYNSGDADIKKVNIEEEQYFVPINYSIRSKMEWFSEYVYNNHGYGDCIIKYGDAHGLKFYSYSKEFLINVKLMLQTCGINTKVSFGIKATRYYPPKTSGDYKYYDMPSKWKIIIRPYELQKLLDLGFNPGYLKIERNNNIQQSSTKFITVTNVEPLENKSDTYCFSEPLRHAGIFNGVITGQCTEIIEYSDSKEYACCTLSSICLPTFVNADKTFNFVKLAEVAGVVTKNLNKIIDLNYYPVPETEVSNKRHRPLGIGVQGLADVFINMEIGFDSPEAVQLNKEIFAVIYYASLCKSNELAKIYGPYETYNNSPISEGKFQFDLWGVEPITHVNGLTLDWELLRESIKKNGVYNSLLLAPMPTASTSQIMGNNECFEPYTSFLYTRSTLAGQFEVLNHKLLKDLIDLNLWNKEMKNKILLAEGSIQNIPEIPDKLKKIYKNSWDLSNKVLIDMSADRGAYVCQSQSLNLSIAEPTFKSLSSMHFYSWKKGLKTGIYYLRTMPKTSAQKFTVEPVKNNSEPECTNCSA